MSNLLNKAKDALSGSKTHDTTTTSSSHGSHTANVIDPTVDSRTGAAHAHHGTGTSTHGVGQPHSSHTANVVDPTVDSRTGGVHAHHSTTTSSHGFGQGTGAGVHGQSSNQSPHSSSIANKLDPRVDSDRDHRNDPASHVGGYGQTQDTYAGAGATNTGMSHGTGTHAGEVTGSGAHTGGLTGSGTHGYGTTGVIESKRIHGDNKILNRLDPGTKTDSAGHPI